MTLARFGSRCVDLQRTANYPPELYTRLFNDQNVVVCCGGRSHKFGLGDLESKFAL